MNLNFEFHSFGFPYNIVLNIYFKLRRQNTHNNLHCNFQMYYRDCKTVGTRLLPYTSMCMRSFSLIFYEFIKKQKSL